MVLKLYVFFVFILLIFAIGRDNFPKNFNLTTMKTYNIRLSDLAPQLPEVFDTDHVIFNPFQFNPNLLDKVWVLNYYGVPEIMLFDPGYRDSKSDYSLFKLWKTKDHALECREEELKLRKRLQMEFYAENPQMEIFPEAVKNMRILSIKL